MSPPRILPSGRHLLGRARDASIRVADPLLAPYHLLVEVAQDGDLRITPLTGRVPARIENTPQPIGQPMAVPVGVAVTVEVGASQLRFDRVATGAEPQVLDASRACTSGGLVLRTPRLVPDRAPVVLDCPPPPDLEPIPERPPMMMLVGSLFALGVSAVMATVIGQPLFMLFALSGVLMSMGMWASGAGRRRRIRRRSERAHRDHTEEFDRRVREAGRQARIRHLRLVAEVADRLWGTQPRWSRRPVHGDAFEVTIGIGDVEAALEIRDPDGTTDRSWTHRAALDEARRLADVPISVDLSGRSRRVIAITGPERDALVRSILMQLASQTGPADWRVLVVTHRPQHLGWVDCLPHRCADAMVDLTAAPDLGAVLRRLEDDDPRRTVLVTDAPELLGTRTSPLRRLLDTTLEMTMLVLGEDAEQVPAVCDAALHTGSAGTARWLPDLLGPVAHPVWDTVRLRIAGLSIEAAESIAAELAELVDPEDPTLDADRLPAVLRLDELEPWPWTTETILESWSHGGADPRPVARIGRTAEGLVEIDLVRDGPHGLIAGTTGSGKSELLRTFVLSLARGCSPAHLNVVLVDYKGGSTFDACADLPHTVGVVTDLDEGLAARALISLDAEIRRRERILRDHGAADLGAYRNQSGTAPLPRLVVIVDEFAALAAEVPGFLPSLIGLAQRGRSLGLHLVLATQRPAGVVDDAIRANTDLRIALRLNDPADARDVVGVDDPAALPRGLPGRAVLGLGGGRTAIFQSATSSLPPVVDHLLGPDAPRTPPRTLVRDGVAAIRRAAEQAGFPPPHRPWLPDLDEVGPDVSAMPSDAIGVIDDPAAQCRHPLRWSRRGNLALIGALGSGTTTTLVALGAALSREVAAGAIQAQIHLIDARGDDPGDRGISRLRAAVGCSGVVPASDLERLDRLLRALVREVDHRRAGPDVGHRPVMLIIDGLMALRRRVDEPGPDPLTEVLDRILTEGPAVGIVTVAALEPGPQAISSLSRFAERWVFHLDERADGPAYGLPRDAVPPAIAGRLALPGCGRRAQVFVPEDPPGTRRDEASSPWVEPLPARLGPERVPKGRHRADGILELPIGCRHVDLAPTSLMVPPGEHVLILGPGRCGRTTLLRRLAAAWSEAEPEGMSIWFDGRRRVAADRIPTSAGVTRPTLVVIDDAERFEDPDGRLAELIAAGPDCSVTVIAAGRADALRATYGHWSTAVRRSRLGAIAVGAPELDGELLGTLMPRRAPIRPRPGLFWVLGAGADSLSDGPLLIQVAQDPGSAAPEGITRADRARLVPTARS